MALGLSNDDLVLYLDVAILFGIFVFAFFGFPRLVAHLSLPHCEGWIIGKVKSTSSLRSSIVLDNEKALDGKNIGSGEGETAPYKIDLRNLEALPTLRTDLKGAPRLPTHIPSYSTLLYPLSKLTKARYDGYSVGQYTILTAYLAAVAVTMFLFSNPVNNITRAGFVCISQAPIVVLFGVKNGPIGALLGKGYEKVCENKTHSRVSYLMMFVAQLHSSLGRSIDVFICALPCCGILWVFSLVLATTSNGIRSSVVKWTKTGTIAIAGLCIPLLCHVLTLTFLLSQAPGLGMVRFWWFGLPRHPIASIYSPKLVHTVLARSLGRVLDVRDCRMYSSRPLFYS